MRHSPTKEESRLARLSKLLLEFDASRASHGATANRVHDQFNLLCRHPLAAIRWTICAAQIHPPSARALHSLRLRPAWAGRTLGADSLPRVRTACVTINDAPTPDQTLRVHSRRRDRECRGGVGLLAANALQACRILGSEII